MPSQPKPRCTVLRPSAFLALIYVSVRNFETGSENPYTYSARWFVISNVYRLITGAVELIKTCKY